MSISLIMRDKSNTVSIRPVLSNRLLFVSGGAAAPTIIYSMREFVFGAMMCRRVTEMTAVFVLSERSNRKRISSSKNPIGT